MDTGSKNNAIDGHVIRSGSEENDLAETAGKRLSEGFRAAKTYECA